MKAQECNRFQEWLDRLPRTELSPEFEEHMDSCAYCSDEVNKLQGVAESLKQSEAPEPLTTPSLVALSDLCQSVARRKGDRKLYFKLTLGGLFSMPIVFLVNYFWGSLGFFILTQYVSPLVAQVYLVMFLVAVTAFSGLSYGAIPLLAGLIRGRSIKENEL